MCGGNTPHNQPKETKCITVKIKKWKKARKPKKQKKLKKNKEK
jgi:hypothetical protein